MLQREFQGGFAVAAHERYLDYDGFRDAADQLDHRIELPRFGEPEPAIRTILARRLEVAELAWRVEDLFADDAITSMATLYAAGPVDRDLRALLGIAEEAVREVLAEPNGPDVVGSQSVLAATTRRLSMRR